METFKFLNDGIKGILINKISVFRFYQSRICFKLRSPGVETEVLVFFKMKPSVSFCNV